MFWSEVYPYPQNTMSSDAINQFLATFFQKKEDILHIDSKMCASRSIKHDKVRELLPHLHLKRF